MVKLNFMSTPPISTTYDGKVDDKQEMKVSQQIEEPVEEVAKEDFADTIFEFEEKPEPVAEPEPKIAPEPKKPLPEKKTPEKTPVSYSFDDDQDTPWKKYGIFAAVALLVVIIGYFGATFFLGPDGEETATQEQAQEEVVAGQQTPGQAETPAAGDVSPRHRENMQQNSAVYKNIQNLLKQPTSGVTQSLMVLSPPQVQISVLANSRDDIAQYHMEMKNNYPTYKFKIISVHSEAGEGSAKYSADLMGEFPAGRGGAPEGNSGINIALSALQREIKKLAVQSGVNVVYYKQGKTSGAGNCNVYLTLSGDTGNLLNFFELFAGSLQQGRLHKVSLNRQKSGSGMTARAEFAFAQ